MVFLKIYTCGLFRMQSRVPGEIRQEVFETALCGDERGFLAGAEFPEVFDGHEAGGFPCRAR